jgi:hypothetical protein
MCSLTFSLSNIERHASLCGGSAEQQTPAVNAFSRMKSMAAAKAGSSPKPAMAKSGTISKSFSRQSSGAVSPSAAGSSSNGSTAGTMKGKPEENGEEIIFDPY